MDIVFTVQDGHSSEAYHVDDPNCLPGRPCRPTFTLRLHSPSVPADTSDVGTGFIFDGIERL